MSAIKCCVAVSICSYLVKSRILSACRSQRYSRRSVVYAIRYPSDFRSVRVLNSALVGCARCTLGFRFPKKFAHQNDPLNQGNLHELKLRLKIVRYPGIEVGNAFNFIFSLPKTVKFFVLSFERISRNRSSSDLRFPVYFL